MRIPLDDETMAAAIEQASSARVGLVEVIAAVVRDAFLAMRAEGVTFVRLAPGDEPPTNSRH
ncbi:MAG TPA: hypothetical protein VIU44_05325 [Gaiellaceae bacterium]